MLKMARDLAGPRVRGFFGSIRMRDPTAVASALLEKGLMMLSPKIVF
jgi:hypothetical protein